MSEPGLLRQHSEAGLELKMIFINQRQSQEKQEGVHQDKCKVQPSKYGVGGGSLNKYGEKLAR